MIFRSATSCLDLRPRRAKTMRRPWPASVFPLVMLITAVLLACGCASSRQAAYQQHLTAVIAQGPAMNDDVAVAFGLDEYAATYAARTPDDQTAN